MFRLVPLFAVPRRGITAVMETLPSSATASGPRLVGTRPELRDKVRTPEVLLQPRFAKTVCREAASNRRRVRMAGSACRSTLLSLACAAALFAGAQVVGLQIPNTATTALNGQPVSLPGDLRLPATVLILGFGRHSQEATTAWERPVRTQLARTGNIGFYDLAMLAEVPGFVRPMVVRAIKRQVPDVLRPNFLPLTESEPAWKQVARYAQDQPEAAYVLLVDRNGRVQWTTHEAFSASGFDELRQRATALAGAVR